MIACRPVSSVAAQARSPLPYSLLPTPCSLPPVPSYFGHSQGRVLAKTQAAV